MARRRRSTLSAAPTMRAPFHVGDYTTGHPDDLRCDIANRCCISPTNRHDDQCAYFTARRRRMLEGSTP